MFYVNCETTVLPKRSFQFHSGYRTNKPIPYYAMIKGNNSL